MKDTEVTDPERQMMTTAEVAALFQVSAQTILRWAVKGRLKAMRTLGGHRRYPRAAVMDLVRQCGMTGTNEEESPMVRTYDADDPDADKPLTKAEREAEEEADRKRGEKRNGK